MAGEPDNFSARLDSKAVVANAQINHVVNSVLDMAIQEYQRPGAPVCDKKLLIHYLDESLDRNLPKIYHSVYVNAPVAGPRSLDDLPYRKGLPYTELYFSPSYKITKNGNDFYIGLDKIDHFFSHGSMYWEILNEDPALPPGKLKKALDVGLQQESATWGLQKTAVKSYGDLAANYHGLYFWRDLFDGKPPLIECLNGTFKRTGSFDVANYFDEAMDESLNCNSYASQEILSALDKVNSHRGLKCPVDPNVCAKLVKSLAPDVASRILHPKCRGQKHSQLEPASPMTAKDIIDTAQAAMGGGGNFLLFKLFGDKLPPTSPPQKGVK